MIQVKGSLSEGFFSPLTIFVNLIFSLLFAVVSEHHCFTLQMLTPVIDNCFIIFRHISCLGLYPIAVMLHIWAIISTC